jgi:hypothetical protein
VGDRRHPEEAVKDAVRIREILMRVAAVRCYCMDDLVCGSCAYLLDQFRAVREEERNRILGGDARERIAAVIIDQFFRGDDMMESEHRDVRVVADAVLKAIGGER